MKTVFITGIDTDTGKSIVTGMIAKFLRSQGVNVITQKLIQTGCKGISEDIITHRQLMNIDLQPEDTNGTTCPIVFSYPCSPHLAAEIDSRNIELQPIQESTKKLESAYDMVLLEGAGGVMVPITRSYYTADYIADNKLPAILVTSPKLGSINHTILSLEALWNRNIEVIGVVYNKYPNSSSKITDDTLQVIADFIDQRGKSIPIVSMEDMTSNILPNFSDFKLQENCQQSHTNNHNCSDK